MKFLLIGRAGQLGWELDRQLAAYGEVVATDRTNLDLTNPDDIRRMVRDVRPQVIVNAAAYTAVDLAESEHQAAMQVNAIAPGVFAEEAKRLGSLLVHYSTDYVFDGSADSPYAEADEPAPINTYGESKLQGECAITESGCRYLTLRTSWVYGPRAKNFYTVICKAAAAGGRLKFVDDQTSVPTPSDFLATCSLQLIGAGAEGLFHLVPSGEATRYAFARAVVEACGFSAEVQPAKTKDFPSAARRPAYSVLDNRKVVGILGRQLPDWRALLRPCPQG